MKYYPLKKSVKASFSHLIQVWINKQRQQCPLRQKFVEYLHKIQDIRHTVTIAFSQSFQTDITKQNFLSTQLDDRITDIERYTKLMMLLNSQAKLSNSEVNLIIKGIVFKWYDSLKEGFQVQNNTDQPSVNAFEFDIYCCMYNLGLLYLYKAEKHSFPDLDGETMSKKQLVKSIEAAQHAAYLFNHLLKQYCWNPQNPKFIDLSEENLEMLKNLSEGIVYRNKYNILEQEKHLISLKIIGTIAKEANKRFSSAFKFGLQFFQTNQSVRQSYKDFFLSWAKRDQILFEMSYNYQYMSYIDNMQNRQNFSKIIKKYAENGVNFLKSQMNDPVSKKYFYLGKRSMKRLKFELSTLNEKNKYFSEHYQKEMKDFIQEKIYTEEIEELTKFVVLRQQYRAEMIRPQTLNGSPNDEIQKELVNCASACFNNQKSVDSRSETQSKLGYLKPKSLINGPNDCCCCSSKDANCLIY